jgi:hypothetical protein
LYIQAPAGERKPWAAQLCTLMGQVVRAAVTAEDRFSLDVRGLAAGVYLLRLSSAAGRSLVSLVIIS